MPATSSRTGATTRPSTPSSPGSSASCSPSSVRRRRTASATARLLRFLLAATDPVRAEADGLVAADGRRHAAAPGVLDEAVRLGLVRRSAAGLAAAPEARAWLKRRLAGGGDAFAGQHRALDDVALPGGGRERACVNRLESPLSALARLKEKSGEAWLPGEAIAAGERLHADFMRAGLQPRLTMRWEPRLAGRQKGEAGAAREIADTAVAARLRVARAVAAIGPELSGVALDVCCFMKGLETVERERQWPARSAKLMLRAALMALSRHYAPPPARARAHAWGAEGYRPDASGIGGG